MNFKKKAACVRGGLPKHQLPRALDVAQITKDGIHAHEHIFQR